MRRGALLAILGTHLLACQEGPEARARPVAFPAASSPTPLAPPAAAAAAGRPLVVFLGDSLTAGLDLPADEAYPALLERALAGEGRRIRVVNAGVSGDTTAGGLARLDWVLALEPDVLVVALGGNDGLRGLPVEATRANLEAIVRGARGRGAEVVLAGILVPPSYGETYARTFAAIFPEVARAGGVDLVPFLLEGVAGDPALNLADGIHPNAAGHERIARTVRAPVLAALERASRSGRGR